MISDMQIYWKHEKGGVYRIVDFVVDETSCRPMVVYQEVSKEDFLDVVGHRWVRPCSDFFSGKFSQVRFDSEEVVPKEGDHFVQMADVILDGVIMKQVFTRDEAEAIARARREAPRWPDNAQEG